VDLRGLFSPLHKKIYAEAMWKMGRARARSLEDDVFQDHDNPRLAQRLNRLKRAFPSNSRAKFARYSQRVQTGMPACCTHYLAPLETLGCRLSQEGVKEGCRADVQLLPKT